MRWVVLGASCLILLVMQQLVAASNSSSAKLLAYHKIVGQQYCSHTRFPRLCAKTLYDHQDDHESTHHHPLHLLSALLNRTIHETNLPTSYVSPIPSNIDDPRHAVPEFDDRHISAIEYCKEVVGMSKKRLEQSMVALKSSPTNHKQDIQTWISAAMTFQQACKDSADTLSFVGSLTARRISRKMEFLHRLASNSIALVNRITTSSSGKPEDADFPNWVISGKNRKLLPVEANVVVAQDGSGDYKTISDAIDAASGGERFVIYVKSGVYKEKIKTNKDGITLIGEGKYSTIITGSSSVAGGSSMPGSATFTITGDGFIARSIGFQNTAGPEAHQALAIYVASDHSVFYDCMFDGNQDTLYALALRQFYRECDIYGTVDFIFGDAAAVFQNCNLGFHPGNGDYDVIMAQGRTDPGQNTGFSLQNCRITALKGRNYRNAYLGRPWKEYSRAVVMESTINPVVAPPGWVKWPGSGSSELKNLYFAEYANVGGGAVTSGRVSWPGFHVLEPAEATKFTVGNFIGGGSWIPPTGVTFQSGL